MQYITITTDEYQGRLTNISHNTISYLMDNNIITLEEGEQLLKTVVVVPIQNNKLFGKLRNYLFGENTDNSLCKYIVTQIQ